MQVAIQAVKRIVAENPVTVFSKTYCPYCSRVKKLFDSLNVKYKAIELDVDANTNGFQDAIAAMEGHRTVPAVYIGGKFIGGCDHTVALNSQGKLVDLLRQAGAL